MIMMTDAQTDKNVVPMVVIGFVYVSAIEPIELITYQATATCRPYHLDIKTTITTIF